MGENAVVAETGRRLWAFLTDEAFRALFFLPFVFSKHQFSFLAASWFLYWSFRSANLFYFHSSPGKYLMSLKVRSLTSSHLSLGSSLIRPLTDDLSVFFGFLPRLWLLIRFDRRHLSDFLAETQVVQAKNRAQFPHRRWGLFFFLVFVCAPSAGLEALELLSQFSF